MREKAYGPLLVRLADPADAADLARRLRPWDMVESLAAGSDPLTSLTRPFWHDHGPWTRAFEAEGRVVGMGGVVPLTRKLGRIWFLGAPEIDAPGLVLPMLAAARDWTALALDEFPELVNVIPARHERAIRWLEKLGFDIEPDILHLRGIGFRRFRRSR